MAKNLPLAVRATHEANVAVESHARFVFDPEELVGTPRCGVREWPVTVAYRCADGAAHRPYHGSAMKTWDQSSSL